MQRIKVGDGDLVIIKYPEGRSYQASEIMQEVKHWVEKRGLQEVRIISATSSKEATEIDICVLSVNDMFQDVVIDDKQVKA